MRTTTNYVKHTELGWGGQCSWKNSHTYQISTTSQPPNPQTPIQLQLGLTSLGVKIIDIWVGAWRVQCCPTKNHVAARWNNMYLYYLQELLQRGNKAKVRQPIQYHLGGDFAPCAHTLLRYAHLCACVSETCSIEPLVRISSLTFGLSRSD